MDLALSQKLILSHIVAGDEIALVPIAAREQPHCFDILAFVCVDAVAFVALMALAALVHHRLGERIRKLVARPLPGANVAF